MQFLHPHSRRAVATGFAVAFVSNKENYRRETDKQIDEILNPRPLAEEKIHDVPIAAQVVTERDETPIESADDNENECNTVQ